MHKQHFCNIILMNYRDIKPKRDKNVTSLKYCGSDRAPEILLFHAFAWEPMVVLKKTYPVLLK